MTITIQRNYSENNRVSKMVSDLLTLTGTLRQETSIIDPVILVEGDLAAYAEANYMTIPAFSRSYFITNIRSIRQGLIEITGHVDVLYSFAGQIRLQTAIIRKNEVNWNLYLNDGTFRVYQNPMVLTKQFPSGFNAMEFVLAVAGA